MRMRVARACVLALVASLPAVAQEEPEPTQLVKGTVVSVSGPEVRLKMAGGRVDRYVVEGAATARLKDLKPGYRVVATIRVHGPGRAFIVGFTEIAPPVSSNPQGTARVTDAGPRRSRILVMTDLACDVSVDFKKMATLPEGGHATLDVEPGERVVTAVAPSGASKNYTVKVGGDQAVLQIVLKDVATVAAPAAADAASAAVVAALADVRGAGSYVAWVLEKKAFGYHDVQLTVSLQRAATRLKRELEKLQGLKMPDAGRTGAQAELVRAAGEAAQYASQLIEAATTAQAEGTSFGKSAQMRGQALAHLPLMAPDAPALAAVRGSDAFRGALTPDRWPDTGLPPDSQDFRLGAEYDGDTPPRLGAVQKGGVADALGLKPGDRLLSVDGKPVKSGWDFKAALRAAAGKPVTIELEREGKRETKKASAKP
jgi:PDZ domain-containing protein